MIAVLRNANQSVNQIAARAEPFALLFSRLVLASVFWRSGLTKVETVTLFEVPFPQWMKSLSLLFWGGDAASEGPFRVRLPLPVIKEDTFIFFQDDFFYRYIPEGCWEDGAGAGCAVVFFGVNAAAVLATIGELAFPLLLAAGLFTRVSALGLLIMTLVIQILVFPTFSHWLQPAMWWAALALVLFARGGGAWSLDRRFGFDGAR